MKKKIKWSELFNDNNFKYNTESKKLKNITAYKLAKIIYPDLNQKKFKKISNFIIKNIEIKKNNKLLDFGSGNGAFLSFFKNKVKKLYSLELSKNLISFQNSLAEHKGSILSPASFIMNEKTVFLPCELIEKNYPMAVSELRV